ncbi:MAG: hypothetical protein ACK4FB_06870 [Brevundimonas sp.]|uniref:hypothetical protein n=1 Tax=Brevundimonas sp. TaxID=1871086 RepID=UPI00391D973B
MPAAASSSIPEFTLSGRAVYVREVPPRDPKWPPTFYTDIVVPAADEYSSPATYQVRSRHRLAEKDQDVSVKVALRSFAGRRTIQTQSGPKEVPNLTLSLQALEN